MGLGKLLGKIVGEVVAAPVTIATESVKAVEETMKTVEKRIDKATS